MTSPLSSQFPENWNHPPQRAKGQANEIGCNETTSSQRRADGSLHADAPAHTRNGDRHSDISRP